MTTAMPRIVSHTTYYRDPTKPVPAGLIRARAPMHPMDDFAAFRAAAGPRQLVGIEPKYDGWQVRFIDRPKRPLFLSRRGEELLKLDHLVEPCRAVVASLRKLRIPSTYVLDAELIHPDGYENIANLNRRSQCELVVYDMWASMIYDLRKVELEEAVPATGPVRLMPMHVVRMINEEQTAAYAKTYFEGGFEGCIFKTLDGPYVNGESPHWYRAVVRKTIDLSVVGAESTLGKVKNLICRHNGQAVRVGIGLSDEQREMFFFQRPRIVEVERRECHENGSYQPFVFRRVRDDKDRVD